MNLKTRLRSMGATYFSSERFTQRMRDKARKARVRQKAAPQVHYFHQVDDPYSHLAVQKLDLLRENYDLPFTVHLVSAPAAAYLGSAQHFHSWAWRDACAVAPYYDTQFIPLIQGIEPAAAASASSILADLTGKPEFTHRAVEIGEQLWRGEHLNQQHAGAADPTAAGNALREQLGHYQGAMFYFEGEWYWGIDRLRSLEQRLMEEGFRPHNSPLCVPEPAAPDTTSLDTSGITLEYFPSLRSPYTAVGHQRVLDMIRRTSVDVVLRPVMPMLMRGIPAPRSKQRYIITDAAREGREHGSPLGKITDPFGEPVKRAFALFPGARDQGGEMAFVTEYLRAAWSEGVDVTNTVGLQHVAAKAGLDWQTLAATSNNTEWETLLQDNVEDMLSANLWGVPSFRVSGGNNPEPFACWGQDRIWRVEAEIARRV